jgi:tetratricopeptide (TPR) repeat protein
LRSGPPRSYAAGMTFILVVSLWGLLLGQASSTASHRDLVVSPGSGARSLDGPELVKIGDLHEVQNHFQEALPYYERAVLAYRQQRNRSGEATALARIGRVLRRQERYDEALKILQSTEGLWVLPAQRLERARALLDLGDVSAKLGRLEDGQRAYSDSRELFDQAKDSEGALDSMVRLAVVLSAAGKITEAVTLLDQAVREAQTRHDAVRHLSALAALGDVKAKGDVTAATATYEEALGLALNQRDREREASIRSKLAHTFQTSGQQDLAIDMASKALALYQSLRDRSREAETLLLLGTLARSSGDLSTAIEYHERALSLYRALRDRPHEAATLRTLSAMYAAQGAQENAQETQQKALLLLSPSP